MASLSKEDARELIKRRHVEWVEHQERWRWALDSLEGGERYRHADYARPPFELTVPTAWYEHGFDHTTGERFPFTFVQVVRRNLVPHISEMSAQGRDLYVLRLFRTPVPALAEFVCKRYLSRVYSRQVTRDGPQALQDWWADIDGRGTDAGTWFRKTVAPILLAVGHVDLVFGRPAAPVGSDVRTKADAKALGLERCQADFILSENLVWWRLDVRGRYLEALALERDEDGPAYHWRHWTATESNAYTVEGQPLPALSWEHGLGACPIVRLFDEKKLRCRHTGKPRLEYACEVQRNVYNRLSELVLSDVFHTHALLQGPEDYCKPGAAAMTFGPGGLLPMIKIEGTNPSYQGFEVVDMPQSGATECRQHIQDELDDVMKFYGLLRPAGQSTSGATISQSGISKAFDTRDGNDILAEVSATIEEAELTAAGMAYRVLCDGVPDPAGADSIKVTYPREFDLFSAEDLAAALADLQALAASVGLFPETQSEILKRLITALLPGLDEDRMNELHAEVDDAVAAAASNAEGEDEARFLNNPALVASDPGIFNMDASAVAAATAPY